MCKTDKILKDIEDRVLYPVSFFVGSLLLAITLFLLTELSRNKQVIDSVEHSSLSLAFQNLTDANSFVFVMISAYVLGFLLKEVLLQSKH